MLQDSLPTWGRLGWKAYADARSTRPPEPVNVYIEDNHRPAIHLVILAQSQHKTVVWTSQAVKELSKTVTVLSTMVKSSHVLHGFLQRVHVPILL